MSCWFDDCELALAATILAEGNAAASDGFTRLRKLLNVLEQRIRIYIARRTDSANDRDVVSFRKSKCLKPRFGILSDADERGAIAGEVFTRAGVRDELEIVFLLIDKADNGHLPVEDADEVPLGEHLPEVAL